MVLQTPEVAPRGHLGELQSCGTQHSLATIGDGCGGVLTLDLEELGLDELAGAFQALIESKLPPNACRIRVLTRDDIYLLRLIQRAPITIGVAVQGVESQEVLLTEDVALRVIQLLKSTQDLRFSDHRFGSSLISFTL